MVLAAVERLHRQGWSSRAGETGAITSPAF
jgi:hypothetical protein